MTNISCIKIVKRFHRIIKIVFPMFDSCIKTKVGYSFVLMLKETDDIYSFTLHGSMSALRDEYFYFLMEQSRT